MCLVPKDKQPYLGHTWPARTKEGTDALLIQAAKQKTKQARKNTLATQLLRFLYVRVFDHHLIMLSLNLIQNIFLAMFSMWFAIFKAFIFDPLHALEQGEFGKHLWPWLLEALPKTSQSEIDRW
jgi:hypothetical protein